MNIENIGVEEDGMESICKYLSNNVVDTKWLNVGYFFKNGWQITPDIADKVCLIVEEQSHHLLRLDIKLPHKYKNRINSKTRENKKQYFNPTKLINSKQPRNESIQSKGCKQYSTRTLLRV